MHRSVIVCALFLVARIISLHPGSAVAQGGSVTYDRGPSTVVVSYKEVLGEVGEADQGPSVQIFGDGRAVVHYPAYMKRAGDYTVQLSEAEIDALLRSFSGKGLLTFNQATAQTAKGEAAARRLVDSGDVSYSSDPSITSIEIHANEIDQRISWVGLRSDATRYPEVSQIQDLAAASRELQRIMERSDLERVR